MNDKFGYLFKCREIEYSVYLQLPNNWGMVMPNVFGCSSFLGVRRFDIGARFCCAPFRSLAHGSSASNSSTAPRSTAGRVSVSPSPGSKQNQKHGNTLKMYKTNQKKKITAMFQP